MTRAIACLVFLLIAQPPALAQTTTVTWDPSPDASAAGYQIKCGAASGTYGAPVDVGAARSFTTTQRPVFCVVAAYNDAQQLGPWSPEVSTLNPGPVNVSPAPQPTPSPDRTLILRGDGRTLTAPDGAVWGFDAEGGVARNGVRIDGGDDRIGLFGGGIYFKNPTYPDQHGSWWTWTPNGGVARYQGDPSLLTTPPPPPSIPAPTVTMRDCRVYLDAEKPAAATGSGWTVQYVSGSTSLTSASTTRKRAVTLTPGDYVITATWVKGAQTFTSPPIAARCG